MTDQIQFKRRINGAAGSPSTTGAKEGEISLNFPKVAGSADKPEIWAYDGAAWRQANPDVAVTVASVQLPGGTTGSATGIGAAWTALTPKPTDPITIAKFAGTAYVKTGAGGTDGDWAALGAATSFASNAEVLTGTDTSKALNPANLRSSTLNAPTGGAAAVAGDADKIVRLNAQGQVADAFVPKATAAEILAGTVSNDFITPLGLQSRIVTAPNATPANDANKIAVLDTTGKIPAGFLPVGGLEFSGTLDPTAATYTAPTPAPKNGQFYTVTTAGAISTAWKPQFASTAVTTVAIGDYMVWDDTAKKFHHIANAVDMSTYVPLAGTAAMTGNIVYSGAANNKAGTIIYDGKGGTIDNVLLDCGTY
jgi:hypothetical protein